ncbi:hypothetical protein Ocin01_03299 [Orchesella cincta]|uniref:Uncharacterized protein n=1 Tax=Orchesella cincta TaxID=48709 RepID=A0A1D2NDN6_ORCCI|nr:hypothetical protein Ocin01_03299 [Orchesella cincta]
MAQELTEETDRILLRSEISISLDQGLDQIDLLKPVNKSQQANLSGSATNIDHTANNSAALGDVVRGRAQERFLTGWKKGGITQPEDIDPSWLVNSMDADSDCGRRLSTCLNSRPYHSDLESSVVSNSNEPNRSRRRSRRVGQVSLPTQFPADSPHSYNIPPPGPSTSKVANGSISIPDGSIQAKQLRLLDRKISMYFGERSSSGGSRPPPTVRKARSYEKLQSNSSKALPHNLSLFSPPQPTELHTREKENASKYEDPTPTVTTISDIETDNCDFHVNPPIELTTAVGLGKDLDKSQEDTTTSSENDITTAVTPEQPSGSTVVFNGPSIEEGSPYPTTLSISSVELVVKQTVPSSFAPKDNNQYDIVEAESQSNVYVGGGGGDDDDPIASLLKETEPDKGLDEESDLWNRMEALSSYQSFNLIRKSTIDPNK